MRRLLAGFRDPARRPRLIIWSGLALIVAVLLWSGGIVGTSFPWFCEQPCHIVHADNTLTYNAGPHSKVSCVACHEPVNASPITFTIMKIFVLPDLWSTATRTFTLPMNPDSEVAVKMPTEQCTQCHNLATRKVTPSPGMIIDHKAHTSRGITCTTCHNRVAHPEENVTYTLPGDRKHENWMTMDACFRCHGQQTGAKAPGTCATCHTPEFKLVPASHETTSWYNAYGVSTGHAKAAVAESASVAAALATTHSEKGEVERPGDVEPTNRSSATVNSCYTCHKTDFCSTCHGGLQMPHPASFKQSHPKLGYAQPQLCAKCHARSAAEARGMQFCNACHHPASTPGGAWLAEHPAEVKRAGASQCFDCHKEEQCSMCHVNGVKEGRQQLRDDFVGGY